MATTAGRVVLRGGSVVTRDGPVRADVAVEADRISHVGPVEARAGDQVIDATDRLVLPGFIDAHSHADGLLADPDVQRTLLRQGVTTVIAGQDGVSYAPGSGTYATGYFAAINGPHPAYGGGGVAAFLAAVDGASAINAAYLVPAGTVRYEVCGRDRDPATADQLDRMTALVAAGMAEGALGLSTGLDYVPGIFQSAGEIAALCGPVARAGGVYVSHMRGGYEANAAAGIAEIIEIAGHTAAAAGSPLPVHVSHFHADADIVLDQLARLESAGIDATFDAYPYIRGCTLLGMPLLPPELSVQPVDDLVRALTDPAARPQLRAVCVARVAAEREPGPRLAAHGHARPPRGARVRLGARADAARGGSARGRRPDGPRARRAGGLQAGGERDHGGAQPARPRRSSRASSRTRATWRARTASSSAPTRTRALPGRSRATCASTCAELGTWSWPDAVQHLSALPAERFALGRRGSVAEGAVADLVVVDPDAVADAATYEDPRRLAVGLDDVFVAGVPVLAGGELTGASPGRGLRRRPGSHETGINRTTKGKT